MGKSILITGGSGFIGTALAQALVKDNEVTAFDNGTRDALKYTELEKEKNFRLVNGDVLDEEAVRENVRGRDVIIHLAAIAGISSYEKNPLRTMEVNLLGTYNMLSAAALENPDMFVNFSTSEVYGPHARNVSEKSMTQQGIVGEKRWTYSVSKLAAEHFGFAFLHEKKLNFTSLRPFNIYGPGQVGEGAIQTFATRALRNEELRINGGSQTRAWCYIDDLVKAVLLMMKSRKAVGETFVIGNPDAVVSVKELAEKVKKIAGSSSKLVIGKALESDIQERIPDIAKARSMLGFEPKAGLDEGLKKTIEWYRKIRA